MITDSYDEKSPAKINVEANENAVRADAVILTFSHLIEAYVLQNYDCEKLGELNMAQGSTSLYSFRHGGKTFGFGRTWVGAPAAVGVVEELPWLLNTKKIIQFGGAGCLDREIARGKIMVPTEAYRDEGTSYHYAPPSD